MRISKKILAIALSILMAVSMMPFTVFADGETIEYTAKNGNVTMYASLPSALNNGTYKLVADSTRTTRIVLGTFASDVTIDLNGHTLTSTASDAFVSQQRTGSESSHKVLSIVNSSSTPAVINAKMGVRIGSNTGAGKYTDFTLGENITLNVSDDAGFVLDVGSAGSNIVINGTVNSAESFGVTVNGNVKDEATAPTITINGKVTGEDAGIYAAGYANYVVNGEVEGATAIYQKGGNLVVNDGAVVTATGASAAYVENGNGMTATGDAIVVEDNGGYKLGTTTIKGGTITSTSEGTNAIAAYDATNAASTEQEQEIVVRGGTFEEAGEPATIPAEYIPEGASQTNGVVTQNYVAKDGNGNYYETVDEAMRAISVVTGTKYKANGTVTLLDDCSGKAYSIDSGSNFTFDLNGYTYTHDGSNFAGSPNTMTQFFQLLKDSTITFKNGTLYSEYAWMLVQNYSNLTLDNMTLTLNKANYNGAYTLSNNNGATTIKDTTINANPTSGSHAFDVCRYSSYPSVAVTVTGDSVINGDVEIYASNGDAQNGFSLTLESGTLNGDIDVTDEAATAMEAAPEKVVITKEATFAAEDPEGYYWNEDGDLAVAIAAIGNTKYDSLEAAFAAAQDGDTITLLQDASGNGIKVPQGKFNTSGLTVDFGGHTYTVNGTTVGSTGTETQGFQLLMDNKITFQNGKIYGSSRVTPSLKFLVQNYSDLTLDNMELELVGNYYNQYTLSNNNGEIVINDSTINAADYSWAGLDASDVNSFAFDVCRYSSYPSVSVTVTGNSVINGDVEVSASGNNAKDGFSLTLESGELTGDIVVDPSAAKAMETAPAVTEIKKEDTFTQAAPEGFEWKSNGQGAATLEIIEDGYNLTVEDEISMNLYVNADAYGNQIKVTYSKPAEQGGGVTTDTFNVADLEQDDKGRYKVTIPAAPAQICDDVTVTVGAHTFTTSVKNYCDAIIADSNSSEALVNLAKAMLDYGKAASAQFSYNTAAFTYAYNFNDKLAGAAEAKFDASANNGTFANFSYIATSVPALRLYLNPSITEDEIIRNEYMATVTINGETKYVAPKVIEEGENAGKIVVDVTGILAEDLDEEITVSFINGTVKLNALKYADAKGGDLGRSIFNYNTAANAYFA